MSPFEEPQILRSVLENLEAAVYLVDVDRRIVLWNRGAEQITGYLRHEVVGRCCREDILVHCDENNTILCGAGCPLAETMRDGKPRQAEVFLRHKNGYRVPVLLRATPIRNRHGMIIGAAESFGAKAIGGTLDCSGSRFPASGGLDAVTGLPDHNSTESRLIESLNFFDEHALPFTLLRIQVDQLENFRAAHGPGAANAILGVVAHTLRNTFHQDDFLGRWKTDQFMGVVMTSSSTFVRRLIQILECVVSGSVISWWGDELSVTVSMGGTTVRTGDTISSLLGRAESALSQSVAKGGHCFTVIDEENSIESGV